MLCNLNGEEIYTPDTVGGATVSQTPQPGFQYNGWNGDASWSYRTIRDNTAEAELTAALSERVNMRFAAQLYCDQMTAVYGYPAPSLPESWDPASGKETSVASINPAALPVFGAYAHSTAREIQVQNDYAGNFKVGGVSIQPVLGIQYQRGRVPMNFIIFDKTLPPANLAVGYYPVPRPPISQFNTLGTELPETGWIGQTYGYLRVGLLNDHLFLTAGASRTWAHVNDYSINSYYLPGIGLMGSGAPNSDHTFSDTRNSLMPSVQPWHDSYMAGILCKVLPNVSVYSSFSTNASVADSTPLWNAGKQYEFGVKCNFFDNRLAVSVDHFQLSESNVSSTNPLYNLGQSTIPLLYANLVNHGYEVNVDGGITKNLSVIMSYTDQKLRDFVGRRRRNIPDNMASLLLNYRFAEGPLKNANVFAGLIHQGDVAGENVNGFTSLGVPEQVGFYVAAFNVINAGAGYKFHHYSFSLNVDNALNQRFWWQASSRSSLASYPSIGIRLATKFDF